MIARDDAVRLLAVEPVDPRMLSRAASEGRVRGIAVDTWRRVCDAPQSAGGTLRRALRDARALHSRERRFVSDALYDLVRWHRLLRSLAGDGADPAVGMWLGWLVHLGLPVEEASANDDTPRDWSPFVDLPGSLATCVERGDRSVLWGVDEDAAAKLQRAVGDDVVAYLLASNARAPTTLRANRLRTDRDGLIEALTRGGVAATPGRWAPDAVVVPPRTHLPSVLRGRAGEYALQDEASQWVAALVGAAPGERIWDVCAGAGGKTLALGASLAGRGVLWATDVRGRALGEAKKRAKQAGVRLKTAVLRDGVPSCDLGPDFDAVLVDAPCSGSGVWRRHPELRWRMADLPELLASQASVLDLGASRVRVGGRLVYATCSVLPEENEAQVAAFLERQPGFRATPVREVAPGLPRDVIDGPHFRAWPHRHGMDGFFAAVFDRFR